MTKKVLVPNMSQISNIAKGFHFRKVTCNIKTVIYKKTKTEAFITTIKVEPCRLCISGESIICYCIINKCLTLNYLRSGDAKNFPWRGEPVESVKIKKNIYFFTYSIQAVYWIIFSFFKKKTKLFLRMNMMTCRL